MFLNYIKIAFRNLTKQKGYAVINVLGLGIGMGICLFLILLDHYAYNYDTHHENSHKIYRLADKVKTSSGSIVDAAITPAPWGEAITNDIPEVENFVRFADLGRSVGQGDKVFSYGVDYVDESIFEVFTYEFKYGNKETAFVEPRSVVLMYFVAETFFGDTNPLGETLMINDVPHTVTGVLRKLPDQSSLRFNMFVPFSSLTEAEYPNLNNWESHNLHTYLLLQEGADVAAIEEKLQGFIEKQFGEEGMEKYQPHLQNLEDIFLKSNLFAEHGESLDISYIYIFSAIAFMILLIACVNFINLATAKSLERAKEVGMRKAVGAGRRQLIFQFLAEAFLLTVLALVIALAFVEFALPWFNDMAEWNVQANYLENIFYLISIAVLLVSVSLLAGGYPAFYLSSFQPALVLKGQKTTGRSKTWLRSGLVVAQFSVAIFLIIGSWMADRQIEYLHSKDLGFTIDNILVLNLPSDLDKATKQTIKGELDRRSEIITSTMASNIPGEQSGSMTTFRPEGQFEEDGLLVNYYSVDEHFLTLFDIELVEGRNFSAELSSDSTAAFIINEAAARRFGWENAVGKTISRGQDEDIKNSTVIGVVENFHFETLHNSIHPLILQYRPDEVNQFAMLLNTTDLSASAREIVDFVKPYNAGLPIGYYFLEDDIADEYTTEEVIGAMLRYFTYLTIFIACMGLLGLASYTVLQRKKEIGIRKVLGAGTYGIVFNLSKEFLKLTILGFAIGAPLAYLLLIQWLNSFAYSTSMSPYIFLGAGLAAISLAMLTISYNTITAANMNPAESLKSE